MLIKKLKRATGQCRLNQDQSAPVLGGEEIRSDTYPQHGSIQLEKLPLGTESVIWARGDGLPVPDSSLPKKKLRVVGNPKTVSVTDAFDFTLGLFRFLLLCIIACPIFIPDRTVISFPQRDRRSLHRK